MNNKANLKIELVEISKLKHALYNPRRLTEEQEKHLTQSIKSFDLLIQQYCRSLTNCIPQYQ